MTDSLVNRSDQIASISWLGERPRWPLSGDLRGVVDDRPERGPATLYFLSGRRRFEVTLGQVAGGESVHPLFLLTDKWTADKAYNNTSRLSFRKVFAPREEGLGQWWTMDQETDTANNINFPRSAFSSRGQSLLTEDGHLRALLLFLRATRCCPRGFSPGRPSFSATRPAGHRGRACKSIILNKSRKTTRSSSKSILFPIESLFEGTKYFRLWRH